MYDGYAPPQTAQWQCLHLASMYILFLALALKILIVLYPFLVLPNRPFPTVAILQPAKFFRRTMAEPGNSTLQYLAAYLEALFTVMFLTMPDILIMIQVYMLTRRQYLIRAAHSPIMSPDSVSSLFPDRPIRPLPKRRLKEKLSPEAAESIKYPPSTLDSAPLFYYPPYTTTQGSALTGSSSSNVLERMRRTDTFKPVQGKSIPGVRNGESTTTRSAVVRRSPPEILNRATAVTTDPTSHQKEAQAPPSTASSVDGYESFENTSNKKKRKIPTAADSVLNSTHSLNTEINSLAISGEPYSPLDDTHDVPRVGSNAHPGTSGAQGMSGSGRGRLGRSGNSRSPLRALSDGSNAWTNRPGKTASQWPTSERQSSGIISHAIASAGKLPPQNQENVSLFQQETTTRAATARAQFTFTCDSQVVGSLQWPGRAGTDDSGQHARIPSGSMPGAYPEPDLRQSKGSARRRSRRRLERELDRAARQRKDIAAENYHHNPPRLEDIWICEFCEYERIFGEPPRALIRDYEIKDRRHRQEDADRKRLLEKAKSKGRKGKKAAKASNKSGQAVNGNTGEDAPEEYDDNGPFPLGGNPSQSTQSESESMVYDDYQHSRHDHASQPERSTLWQDNGTTLVGQAPRRVGATY